MLVNYNIQFINLSIVLLFFLSINGYLYINSTNKDELNKPDIFIDVKVIHSSSSSTISKFSIDNGKVTGYFLERESGTNAEEREADSMKRIPPSTYEFVKNDCFRYLYNSKRPNCAIEFRLVTKTNKEVGNRNWNYYIRLDTKVRDLELYKLTLNYEKTKQKLQSII